MKSNGATSISEPAAPAIDAARLAAFARARNMAYQWRTIREGGQWRGDVRMGHSTKTMIWWTDRSDDQQKALDAAIGHAIDYFEEQARRVMNVRARAPGHLG